MATSNENEPLKPAPPAGIVAGTRVPVVPPLAVPLLPPKPPLEPQGDAVARATVKAAAEKILAAEAEQKRLQALAEDDEGDPRPSDERLEAFATKIKERYEIVAKIFKDTTYDPTKNKDFKKFLDDQVAEMAMRFVRVGVVHAYDADAITPDARERVMKAKGFAVGQSAKGEANAKQAEANETGETTSAGTEPTHDAHDRGFLESPVVQAAKAMGFDPHSDD